MVAEPSYQLNSFTTSITCVAPRFRAALSSRSSTTSSRYALAMIFTKRNRRSSYQSAPLPSSVFLALVFACVCCRNARPRPCTFLAEAFANVEGVTPVVRAVIGGRRAGSRAMAPQRRGVANGAPKTAVEPRTTALLPLTVARGGGASRTATELAAAAFPTDVVFDNAPMWQYFAVAAAANAVGFVISLVSGGSHLHLDLIGSGAFAIAAVPVLIGGGGVGGAALTPRVQISSAAVIIWAVKLAGFLFFRALRMKHDARLEDILSTVGGTFAFWIMSAIWAIMSALPHALGITSSSPGNTFALYVGTALYVVGLVIESLADYQKWDFKQNNPGKFCNVGLWSLSQHPNFMGNLLLWTGIFILNAPALVDPVTSPSAALGGPTIKSFWDRVWSYRRVAVSFLSPFLLFFWFEGQVEGSVGSAVEQARVRYGDDPAYLDYLEKVPLLFPRFFGSAKR